MKIAFFKKHTIVTNNQPNAMNKLNKFLLIKPNDKYYYLVR